MDDAIKNHYRNLVAKHGDSHLAGQYSTKETQELRFYHLLRAGDISGKRILDFGCGTAALAGYIAKMGIDCSYVGHDFVEEFYPIAQKKYPKEEFISAEQLNVQKFDFIFVSGVFNNKSADNQQFYQDCLVNLFKKTRICLGFNMLSKYVEYNDDGLFYEYPEKVFEFSKKNITPLVTIINDYRLKKDIVPFEFACFLYRG